MCSWTSGTIDPGTTMLGTPVALPVALAPAALQGLAHPEGESCRRGPRRAAKLIYCLSTFANRSLETVAAAGRGTRWFQLYVLRDRGRTAELVARAAAAGYRALMLTVDLPLAGYRERELRDPLLPARASWATSGDMGGADFLEGIGGEVDPSLDWDDLAWLRSLTDLPLVHQGHPRPGRRGAGRRARRGRGRRSPTTAAASSTGRLLRSTPSRRSSRRWPGGRRSTSTAACGAAPTS